MLNGPALLRVLLVVLAAAALTGLVQRYWTLDSTPPDPRVAVVRPSAPPAPERRAESATARPPPVSPQPPPAPQQAPAPPPAAASPPRPPEPSLFSPTESQAAAFAPAQPPAAPVAPPRQTASRTPAPIASQMQAGEAEVAAAEAADPRAVDLIDLNTGSLSALNGLKGGGAIGRAIIQHRPYATIDQLLSKRVLSRSIYQRVKDQVTVR